MADIKLVIIVVICIILSIPKLKTLIQGLKSGVEAENTVEGKRSYIIAQSIAISIILFTFGMIKAIKLLAIIGIVMLIVVLLVRLFYELNT